MWPAVCSSIPHAPIPPGRRWHGRRLCRSVAGQALVRAEVTGPTARGRDEKMEMINVIEHGSRAEQPVVRDARAEEIAARFAGIAPSTVAIGLVLETPSPEGTLESRGALAFGPEPFD